MRRRPYELPRLGLVEGFEAAARNLSFTKAAAELFLTQSAVSRQVKTLEDELGVALFHRETRGLRLTTEGETLYRTLTETLRDLEAATRRIRGRARSRAFTVSTTPAFASLWLIPRLAGYTRDRSGVDVRISATTDVVDLERTGIELAIRYTTAERGHGGDRLFGEEVMPVCAPALLSDPARPLSAPEDLRHHVLIHYADLGGTPSLDWNSWLASAGLAELSPAGALHLSHYDQVILSAVAAQGVALGRLPLVERFIRGGDLIAPFSARAVAPRAYYLLQSPAAAGNDDVTDFVAWLRNEAAGAAPSGAPEAAR